MALIRVVHDKNNPYVILNKTILDDNRVDFKGKGLYAYAFGRPDDWVFYMKEMLKHTSEGIGSIRSGLKQLEKAGYLYRFRKRDEKGQLKENSYMFFETPKKPEEIQKMLPKCDFPTLEKPTQENCTLLNKEEEPSKEEEPRNEKEKETHSASAELSQQPLRLSNLLFQKIQESDPKAKKPDMNRWATEISRLNRLDGRSWEEIESLINFSQDHEFWKGNILSAAKLRKHATKLTIQLKNSKERPKENDFSKVIEENKLYCKKFLQENSIKAHQARESAYHVEIKIKNSWANLEFKENGFKDQLRLNLEKGGHLI